MKFLSSLFVALSVFALSVSPAYATAEARNVNIWYSSATATANENVSGFLNTDNWADEVVLDLDVWENTGGNDASGGGFISTGPAGALTWGGNNVNTAGYLIGGDVSGLTLAENDTIGYSEVSADAQKSASLAVNVNNRAWYIVNLVNGGAITGENTANGGFWGGRGGEIYTGEALFGAGSTVNANGSFFDVFVDMSGNTTARNVAVGYSGATANAATDLDATFTNTNVALGVGNLVNGAANSGDNTANGGDGWDGGNGGLIGTGPAGLYLAAGTTVNTNNTAGAVDLGGTTKAENLGIYNSEAVADAEGSASLAVTNNNYAFLVGNVIGEGLFNPSGYAFANTGGNSANGSEGWDGYGGNGGVILTGAAGGLVFADTSANSNTTAMLVDVGGDATARNVDIVDSPGSAYAYADSSADVAVENANFALGGNLISVGANSGWNEANGSEGEEWGGDGGLIVTGDVGLGVGSSLAMNANITVLGGSFGGNAKAENLGVYDSYAYAGANQDSDGTSVFVGNFNSAFAVNDIEANANSGGNNANGTDDGNGGVIYTGEALLLVEADTTVNTSATYVVGDFGGNATARNVDIGVAPGSAYAYADSSSDVTVINDNGDIGGANVTTSVYADANTGYNNANGGGDEIYSGTGWIDGEDVPEPPFIFIADAYVGVDVVTDVNSTTTWVEGAGGGNATATNIGVVDSSATADASSQGSVYVGTYNAASVNTAVGASANTGSNNANAGGTIVTGSAVNETMVDTTVNTTDTTVVVKQGSAEASNVGVSGSSANATAESSTNVSVETSNDATVTTTVETGSNTGGNTTADGGTIVTGAAVGVTNATSDVNTSTGTFVIGN